MARRTYLVEGIGGRMIPMFHPSGYPEADAVEALRSDYGPHRAAMLSDHLSAEGRRRLKGMATFTVSLRDIVRSLQEKKIPFVVTGAHGFGSWTGRARATHDVDLLVKAGRNHARAVKAVAALYPQLEVRRFNGLDAFFVPGEKESIIDVALPQRADNEETLRTAILVTEEGLTYRVPRLETALANKYGAMLALNRPLSRRIQDLADFAAMVGHSEDEGREPIDLVRLAELGEMAWPGGGGREILKLVETIKRGEMPPMPTR